MTDCTFDRGALLVAELDELRGRGDTDVARHVRECARCRDAAGTILARTAALGATLDRGVAARVAADPARVASDPAWRRRTIARRVLYALPVAAAAAVALFFAGGELLRAGDDIEPFTPPARVPHSPVVNAAGNGGVAVMSTPNPAITVVWTF
jgi:predicted anti-sigma-YlaC factor YlaD